MGRHRERKGIDNGVNNDRAIFIRKSLSDTLSNVRWIFKPNPFRAHCLGNLGEVWILEVHSKRNEAGLLLLDMYEVELLIVEDDLYHGSSPFNLRQQIAQSQHCESSISGQRDALPARICQRASESVRRSIGHRRPRERAKEPAVFATINMSRQPNAGSARVSKEHRVV